MRLGLGVWAVHFPLLLLLLLLLLLPADQHVLLIPFLEHFQCTSLTPFWQ
jgi:hypothetical protein